VELGAPNHHPILLADHHVKTLAIHLPAQVDSLWRSTFYTVSDGQFTMNSSTSFKTAVLSLGNKKQRKSSLKLDDLRYLSYIYPMVQEQLLKYTESLPDLLTYVVSALASTVHVEPMENASKDILYYQLFAELKSLV
jgi:hypothetical protein